MRAEAVSWDDWSASHSPPIAEDDKWHVEIEPNDVKVVSLEQLDDLFRLSIVDSETKVWQAGMSDWQPLRVIAGLDEPSTPHAPPARKAPPKPPSRSGSPSVRPAPPPPPAELQSVRPPAPPAVVHSVRSAAPPAVVYSVRPPAPMPRSVRPPAPMPRSATPAGVRPGSTSFYPEPILAAPAAHSPTVTTAPLAFAKTAPAMNSVRPLVVSHAPPVTPRGGGGFGRLLVGLSLVAGVGVTAYRNDYLRDAAHAAHQDALYARLESALGGPAFGTLRALEQSAAAQPALELGASLTAPAAVRTVDSPAAAVASPVAPPQPSVETHPAAPEATNPPAVSLESLRVEKNSALPRAASAPIQPKPAAVAPAKPTAAARAAKAAAEKPPVEKPTAVAHKPASEMTERERLNAAIGESMTRTDSSKAKAKKAKSNGNEYDPLNPNL